MGYVITTPHDGDKDVRIWIEVAPFRYFVILPFVQSGIDRIARYSDISSGPI